MLGFPKEVVIFDTEYTSWEGAMARNWSGPNEYREIVQIGAIRVETNTLEFTELDSLMWYGKPIKNPILSDYFKDLTGISQEIVEEEGTSLSEAVQKFYDWTDGATCFSWGLDGKDIEDNCALINIPFPFAEGQCKNMKDIFVEQGIKTEGYMSSTLVEAFGIKKIRRGHDGLDDARTIADALRLLAKQKRIS